MYKNICEHKLRNCNWMTETWLKQQRCRPNFLLISFPLIYHLQSQKESHSSRFTPLRVRRERTRALLLKMQYPSVVLFYGARGKVWVKKRKKYHQVNACNTVTCLINIMGLILPGLSSAYVGERVNARFGAGAQAGSASRESKLHIVPPGHCPRWGTLSCGPAFLQLPEKPPNVQMEMEACETTIRYSMFWAGKRVTKRIFLLGILKAEINPRHLFNLYPCKQWMHILLSKLDLYCGASLSSVNTRGRKRRNSGFLLFHLFTVDRCFPRTQIWDEDWGGLFFSPLNKITH